MGCGASTQDAAKKDDSSRDTENTAAHNDEQPPKQSKSTKHNKSIRRKVSQHIPVVPVIEFEVGDIISGKYEVTRVFGRCTVGTSYVAIDSEEDQNYFVKVILSKQTATAAGEGDQLDPLSLAMSEIKGLLRLHHVNVQELHDALQDTESGVLVVISLYQEGVSVARKAGKIEVAEVRSILRDTALGIRFLHSHGIIHRNINLHNILQNKQKDGYCIADCGLGRFLENRPIRQLFATGCQAHLSPEILIEGQTGCLGTNDIPDAGSLNGTTRRQSLQIDPSTQKSDVWAFGITMYKLMFGKYPFQVCENEHPTLDELKEVILSKEPEFPPDCPVDFRNVCSAALTKNPANRPTMIRLLKYPFFRPPEVQFAGPTGISSAAHVALTSGFQLVKVLGRGKHGETYLVYFQKDRSRQFVLHAHETTLTRRLEACKIEESNVQIRRDLAACKKVRHPVLLPTFAFVQGDGPDAIFLALQEYVPDGNISTDYPSLQNNLANSELRSMLRDVTEALSVLHANSLCHLNLTPQNVFRSMLRRSYVVADYGPALGYFPQELFAGGDVSSRCLLNLPQSIIDRVRKGESFAIVDIFLLGLLCASSCKELEKSLWSDLTRLIGDPIDPQTILQRVQSFRCSCTICDNFVDFLQKCLFATATAHELLQHSFFDGNPTLSVDPRVIITEKDIKGAIRHRFLEHETRLIELFGKDMLLTSTILNESSFISESRNFEGARSQYGIERRSVSWTKQKSIRSVGAGGGGGILHLGAGSGSVGRTRSANVMTPTRAKDPSDVPFCQNKSPIVDDALKTADIHVPSVRQAGGGDDVSEGDDSTTNETPGQCGISFGDQVMYCAQCHLAISIVVYKCDTCEKYLLCSKCAQFDHHAQGHVMDPLVVDTIEEVEIDEEEDFTERPRKSILVHPCMLTKHGLEIVEMQADIPAGTLVAPVEHHHRERRVSEAKSPSHHQQRQKSGKKLAFLSEEEAMGEHTVDSLISECIDTFAQELLLHNMCIQDFPPKIIDPPIEFLTSLDMSNNQLTELPHEISLLQSLRRLVIGNNKIRELPEAIGDLGELQYLDANHNELSDLPPTMMFAEQLSLIAVDYNQFSEFPGALLDMNWLHTLFIAENHGIREFPELESLKEFQQLKITVDNDPQLVSSWEKLKHSLPNITMTWHKIYPDEIVPYVFCGSLRSAQSPHVYERLSIGYLLTVGRGLEPLVPPGMRHKVIIVDDIDGATLDTAFDEAIGFIDEAVKAKSGCLVHCFAGMSRSATTVIAYLMKCQKMRLDEAYNTTKAGRPAIYPNAGFFGQLIRFDEKLYPGQRPLDIPSMGRENVPHQ